jgi:iron complex outermembrane receptor protein
MGSKESSSTYKVAARWQPTQTMLFRGSYGTGFKAPSMLDIGQPLVNAGFTGKSWACPAVLKAENPDYCRPGNAQYNVISGGNENLKPEKSKQYTIGFRLEPVASFSVSADLWDVKLTDAVDSVNEEQIFNDAAKFRSLFTTYTEPATGDTYWAKKTLSINIGQKHFQGIDWETMYRHRFAVGNLTTTLSGTYMLKADYTMPGTSDQWTSDMNYFGVDNNVVFRHVVRLNLALETGKFMNTLTANYRNGYIDAEATARNTATNKNELLRLDVPSYMTFDWQGKWNITKAASLRAGVKNLTDKAPPLSLRSNNGHQVGFDPRYADMIGRTFYMTGSYNF